MKTPEESDTVFKVKYRHGNSVASLQYTRVNKSIIFITMRKRKAPINMLSCSKVSKAQQVAGYKHFEKQEDLLERVLTLARSHPHNHLAKVSVSVKTIIPCLDQHLWIHCHRKINLSRSYNVYGANA